MESTSILLALLYESERNGMQTFSCSVKKHFNDGLFIIDVDQDLGIRMYCADVVNVGRREQVLEHVLHDRGPVTTTMNNDSNAEHSVRAMKSY